MALKIKSWMCVAGLLWMTFPVAQEMSLELRCDGKTYVYPGGFGAGTPTLASDIRTFHVDRATRSLSTASFFGRMTAPMIETNATFAATFECDPQQSCALVKNENVTIDRRTGKAISLYEVQTQDGIKRWMAFEGECKQAKRRN